MYAGKTYCHDLRPEGCEQRRVARNITLHPDYNRVRVLNDIAIIKLEKPFKPNERVRMVCLPSDNCSLSQNSDVQVVGCGRTREPSATKRIQKATLSVINNTACSNAYPDPAGLTRITDDMFCAGTPTGQRDTCSGDSGGGAFSYEAEADRFVQVGVISWGSDPCGKEGEYTVFAKVFNYLSWIRSTVKSKRAC